MKKKLKLLNSMFLSYLKKWRIIMLNNFSKIESIIFNHNPIDLLAKLSYLSWMMKTDAFSDLDEQSFTFLQVKEALYYVLAFLFSHQVSNINENKI